MYVHLHLLPYNLNLFSPIRLPSLPHEMCLVRVSPRSPSGHSVVLLRVHLPLLLPPSSFWALLLWIYFLHLASRTLAVSCFLSLLGRSLLFPNLYMMASPSHCLQPQFFFTLIPCNNRSQIFALRTTLCSSNYWGNQRAFVYVSYSCQYLYNGN